MHSRLSACLFLFAVFCALSPFSAHAAEETVQAQPPSPGQGKALANDMAHMVLQRGVYACAERVNQVSSFLGASSSSGAVAMVSQDQPNSRLFPMAMEVPTETGSAFVSASFAPNQSNGCGASYDAVVYWPQSCLIIAGSRFGAFKNRRLLGKNIIMLDGGASTKVFLMPADTGCVSIKQEVVM